MAINEREFPSLDSAAEALAGELVDALRSAIARRGVATLAVSGGRTPVRVFQRLARADVDWRRVTVTLTDERWVPPHHAESNERLVRQSLLREAAADAAFVPLFGGEPSPEAGQPACEARLEGLPLPLDAVYLGMGPDGHFASLFPGDPALDVSEGLCVPIPASAGRVARMSLTANVIMEARRLFLLFSGAAKHAMYAMSKERGSHREIPLRLVVSREDLPLSVLSSP